MKKTVWIFLFAVLLPSAVLGWLALRSAEEQQIVFERRTAELYQKETESLAASVREAVESERRSFGDTVHKLLAKGDANALARDFTNTLADAWGRRAVGFALGADGRLISPNNAGAAKNPEWRRFLLENSSFLSSTEPAQVYYVPVEAQGKIVSRASQKGGYASNAYNNAQSQPEATAKDAELDAYRQNTEPIPATRERKKTDEQTTQAALAQTKQSAGEKGLAEKSNQPAAPVVAELAKVAVPKAAAKVPAASVDAPVAELQAAKPEVSKPQEGASSRGGRTAMPSPMPAAPAAPAGVLEDAAKIAPALSGDKFKSAPNDALKESDGVSGAPQKKSKEELGGSRRGDSKYRDGLDAKFDKREQATADDNKPAEAEKRAEQNVIITKNEANLLNRKVEPQQVIASSFSNWSSILPSTSDFQTLTKNGDEGTVSRFVQDKLDLVFWIRPPEAPELVFGCLVDAAELRALWPALFAEMQGNERYGERPSFVLALLDDKARPTATHLGSNLVRDWKHPFVASEIGEVLPHWEAALYLASPTALADSARGLRRTLTFTIAGAVALIAFGGWLVVADARRQLALAQKKTDFVSNVSHELKTPLTSIRMFAELMHDRPPTAEKQGQYLRIISVEAERLTRLINNVLDFAKLERRQKRFEKKPFDFHAVIERVWESHGLHLRESGFSTRWEAAPPPYSVVGDEDALSQILVNLLSNAEKYSIERKEVEMHSWIADDFVNVSVLDRGMGVPAGEEQKIYEAFYRAHDSLSSGIQGSGLGLTLAQRLAREHGGEILFERREGGGSRFTLRIPISNQAV